MVAIAVLRREPDSRAVEAMRREAQRFLSYKGDDPKYKLRHACGPSNGHPPLWAALADLARRLRERYRDDASIAKTERLE
jgi:hypothetical protein